MLVATTWMRAIIATRLLGTILSALMLHPALFAWNESSMVEKAGG